VTRLDLRSPFSASFRPADADALAVALKALAAPARLRILALLHAHSQMANRDLEEALGLSQPTVAHHLQLLGEAGLIRTTRQGVWGVRTLNEAGLADLVRLLTPGGAE
jgi:ArsR family transcriptional regulator